MDKMLSDGKLKLADIKIYFSDYADVQFLPSKHNSSIGAFYSEGMVDTGQLNDYLNLIFDNIDKPKMIRRKGEEDDLPPTHYMSQMNKVVESLFSGYLLVFKEGRGSIHGFDIAKIPQRPPSESNAEVSLKGPKDGFTEEIHTNISLIRKRIKTPDLYNESFVLGSISKTKVSLLYLKNKANMEMITEARHRLSSFEGECVISSGQLEQWISDRTFSLFPLYDSISRPDFTIECLFRGRFIIIVDGSPMVLIGPINLFELIKSPEDVHFPYHIIAFQRIFRFIGLIIAVFLPGFWIAIASVNIDQIPFTLLATVVEGRKGLPLPITFEFIFILSLFELLKEAGIRMPKAVGQTVAIVGGLVIGDASIRAGLASPTLLVVVAITAVASYTLVNQSLSGTVSILRIYILLVSSYLGVYGFVLSVISIIVYLSKLESFKMAYLEPLASLSFNQFLSALLINPFKRRDLGTSMFKKGRGKV
ncbi:spore germination protein [Bacillus sp. RAR_GA_16]|uniref:spore germination protein n=1 Tax=Bacillus sp. RAR_GA_16 TaxID=2876774 RepID=UPI001CCD27A3|nr:spore germination protein [Bacillus sp. RAR_GA_16]MCA0171383.1 spore germination protein [Bacillus sp. RAR_GA_16]